MTPAWRYTAPLPWRIPWRRPNSSAANWIASRPCEGGDQRFSQPPSIRGEIDREPEGRRARIEAPRDFAADRICRRDVDGGPRSHQDVDLDEHSAARLRDVARVFEK